MKLIIVGANDYQKAVFEPLKNIIDVEVVFVDSIVKIEPDKFTLINTPKGILPDFMISDDVIGDHKLNKDLIDFNQGKRLSSLDDIELTDENGFYPFERLFDDKQIDHGLGKVNDIKFTPNKHEKDKPKQITYGPKQSCGKGKTKRWKS